jgi:hypothetical protein
MGQYYEIKQWPSIFLARDKLKRAKIFDGTPKYVKKMKLILKSFTYVGVFEEFSARYNDICTNK